MNSGFLLPLQRIAYNALKGNFNTWNIMEKTLILIKPNAIQRGLIGDIVTRFERKGLRFVGIKMLFMTDEIVNEHYAHLKERPFFPYLKASMQAAPIIACCVEGAEAVETVRLLVGATNSRKALPGTIRVDFSVSGEQNVVHASDSVENALIEINRFFAPGELFDYESAVTCFEYGGEESLKFK
jgi:nucleoside-diphosphate kinase